MPRIRQLVLTEAQRQSLEEAVRCHPKPHMREKASALLKVASGIPAAQVATAAIGLRARNTDTIYEWLDRYEQRYCLDDLEVQPGRGRKPAFSPSGAGR